MAVINAEKHILGRLSSMVAQRLLAGEDIDIVNAEKAIITGSRADILRRYNFKRTVGSVRKGPNYPRMPDRMLKRTVKGMLGIKKSKGKDAYKRLTVHIGVPYNLKKEKFETIESAQNLEAIKFLELGEVSKMLGAKFGVDV